MHTIVGAQPSSRNNESEYPQTFIGASPMRNEETLPGRIILAEKATPRRWATALLAD
jgi:hypothetical protein